MEKSNHWGCLLRDRGEWQTGNNTANERDEFPSPHEPFPETRGN
jgi:hypothetical protein